MQIKVKGLESVAMSYVVRRTELRERFNQNLRTTVDKWQRTTANTFVHKEGLAGYKAITDVVPLARLSGGTRGTQRASIILSVESTSLTDFTVLQERLTKGMRHNEAFLKKGKYKESLLPVAQEKGTYTSAKLLRQGKAKLVVVGNKKGTLKKAKGLKGFMYHPKNRVDAKPGTPLGVYVRLQQATWKKGKRLPIYKLNAPPLAMLMLSSRVMTRAKVIQSLENLVSV